MVCHIKIGQHTNFVKFDVEITASKSNSSFYFKESAFIVDSIVKDIFSTGNLVLKNCKISGRIQAAGDVVLLDCLTYQGVFAKTVYLMGSTPFLSQGCITGMVHYQQKPEERELLLVGVLAKEGLSTSKENVILENTCIIGPIRFVREDGTPFVGTVTLKGNSTITDSENFHIIDLRQKTENIPRCVIL